VRDGPGFPVNLWHFLLLCLLDVLFRVLNRIEVFGRELITGRNERGVLILCNHVSALDPLLIGVTAMPRFSRVRWRAAAKEELFRIPVLSWIVRSIGGFPVRRGQHDETSMERMAVALETDVLVVFPEGTWSSTGEILPGRTGVGRVIRQARPKKIIPAAVKGTDDILPRNRVLPGIGKRARIRFGAPLDLSAFYSKEDSLETAREIVDVIMEEIRRLYDSL
jgi:1-acyl-sn-glycerol-3-phosphate acyltransferase